MANLKLINPREDLEKEYIDMILEWKESGEELIPWSLTLDVSDFSLMVKTLNGYRKGINLPDGFIKYSTYWLVDNNNILGVIDI